MSKIWNTLLDAAHDLLLCNFSHGSSCSSQRHCDNHNPCHDDEDVCVCDNCFDNDLGYDYYINCDYDVYDCDNIPVNYGEYHSTCSSYDLISHSQSLQVSIAIDLLLACLELVQNSADLLEECNEWYYISRHKFMCLGKLLLMHLGLAKKNPLSLFLHSRKLPCAME
jgi:hypothetical protein